MAGIKDYSTTQANNTSLNGISTAEGMLPSNLNNAIRALMKNTRDWYNDSQWVEYGDGSGAYTATYASATSFTIDGVDVTSFYHAGRRIKLTASTPGTIYGTIASSSFSTNTTINVTWDSGSLSNEAITNVYVAALSKTNSSIPTEIIGTSNIADGAVTTAKIAADAVNGSKIADDSIDSEHYVDGSIDTAHIADSQITDAKLATDSVTTVKITDANVTTAKIAADAITNAKIADDSIDSEQYVDGSIDTAHIADLQITLAKLASSSVNSSKIVDDSIVNADINSSAAIDATKIHDGTISNTEFGYLNGVTSGIQSQLDAKLVKASNLSDLTAASTAAIATSFTLAGDTGSDTFNGGETLTFAGGPGLDATVTNNAVTFNISDSSGIVSASAFSSPSQGTARATNGVNVDVDLALQTSDSPTFAGLTINGNSIVTGDLTVQGTTTTLSTTNTAIKDKFILLNSGSANPDQGGIIIDEGSGTGHGLIYDEGDGRFGINQSVSSTATSANSEAYVALVVDQDNVAHDITDTEYHKRGNMKVDASDDIYIYV